MDESQFKERTKNLGLRVIRLVESLPHRTSAQTMARQLLRSGTSIGANCRAACRGRSRAEVIARMAIVEEEADETMYWLEMLADAGIVLKSRLTSLARETDEILAMVVAPIPTMRNSASNPKSRIQNPKSTP